MRSLPNTVAVHTNTRGQGAATIRSAVLLQQPTQLVSDPTFTTADDGEPWTTPAGWSIAGGKALHAAGVDRDPMSIAGLLTVGNWYLVRFTVKDYVEGNVGIGAGTSFTTMQTADGQYAGIIQCADSTTLYVAVTLGAASDLSVDTITVYDLDELVETDLSTPVIDTIDYAYGAAPTAGELVVGDATGIIYHVDVPTAKQGHIEFPHGLCGTAGKPLAVILNGGGAGVTSRLNVISR